LRAGPARSSLRPASANHPKKPHPKSTKAPAEALSINFHEIFILFSSKIFEPYSFKKFPTCRKFRTGDRKNPASEGAGYNAANWRILSDNHRTISGLIFEV